ncbi:MAG: C40 family peptidase [Bacilli bacterium]|nr:C40 family peptidase [Bacilli bacterium]
MYILDCNSSLGTCCNDYSIAIFIAIIKNAITVLQIIVPILLIAMSMVELFKMMTSSNPEDKKGIKSLTNKFVAAAIVFFLPILANITISLVGEGVNTKGLDVIKCYKESSSTVEVMNRTRTRYIKRETKNKEPVKVTFDEKDIAEGSDGVNPNDREPTYKKPTGGDNLAPGDAQGILDGAKTVHTMYEQNGWYYYSSLDQLRWNDIKYSTNNPSKATCCATFVGSALYVGRVFTEEQLNQYNYNSQYGISELCEAHNWIKINSYSDLQAGDIVIMSGPEGGSSPGHVQIYAGNGTWYNAGSTNAIQRVNPYSSDASARFLWAWRKPA